MGSPPAHLCYYDIPDIVDKDGRGTEQSNGGM